MATSITIFFAFVFGCLCVMAADPIPDARRVPWVPGQTVGVVGGYRLKTNIIDVTQSPYFADPTGVVDASVAVNAAITAAPAGSVIYTPAGRYLFANPLFCNKSDIGFRGDGPGTRAAFQTTNTVWISVSSQTLITLGHGEPSASLTRQYSVVSGATIGSTNITLLAGTNGVGEPIVAGTMMRISTATRNTGTADYPIFSVANFDYIIKQVVKVVSRTGTNLVIWPPLCWNFTNAPIMQEIAWVGGGVNDPTTNIVVEGIQFSGTNYGVGTSTSTAFLTEYSLCMDSMFTNCSFYYGNNYNLFGLASVNMEIRHCDFQYALSSGTSHAGLLLTDNSGLLCEDNIFASGLGPGIEYNGGIMGTAFSYNYFASNIKDIECHGIHPAFNLFEGNIGGVIESDGYFGSESDTTVFRNRFTLVQFKRFVSHMNVTGNVLGTNSIVMVYDTTTNNYPNFPVIERGYPNVGNGTYDFTTTSIAWNWPGSRVTYVSTALTNGINVLISEGPTNNLHGVFTNVPIAQIPNTPMQIQSAANTNYYYGFTNNEPIYAFAAGTMTNLLIYNGSTTNNTVKPTNGDTLFMAGQAAYQGLQMQSRTNHILTMNGCYITNTYLVVIDPAITDTNLPNSYLYGAKPSWMLSANVFPPVDPVSGFSSIPAQDRFNANNLFIPVSLNGKTRVNGGVLIR